MAVGYKSGVAGHGTWNGSEISDITNIQVDNDSMTQRHQTSSTAGVVRRISGGSDKSGSMTVMRDDVPFDEGESGTLILYSDAGTEIYNALTYIERISANVPIDGGGNVTCNVTFGRTVA